MEDNRWRTMLEGAKDYIALNESAKSWAQGCSDLAGAILWSTYDSCADWCAARGLKGTVGDALPNLLSKDVLDLINEDPEAFEERVRQCAYARAMDAINRQYEQSR